MANYIEENASSNAMIKNPCSYCPQLNPSLFWRADRLTNSSLANHIPFIFWLANKLRPNLVVDPCIVDDQSYFAFCQAIERLNLSSRCYAYYEEAQEKSKKILSTLEHNETRYTHFSKIQKQNLDSPSINLANENIDILLLDCGVFKNQLVEVIETVKPRMSQRGIFFLYNTDLVDESIPINSFISAVSTPSEQVIFEFGAGIALILPNRASNAALNELAELYSDLPSLNAVQTMFTRLGDLHRLELKNTLLAHKHQDASKTLKSLEAQNTALGQELSDMSNLAQERLFLLNEYQEQLRELRLLESEQIKPAEKEPDTAQADVLNAEIQTLKAQYATKISELENSQHEINRLTEQVVLFETQRSAQHDEVQNLKKSLQDRFREISVLTNEHLKVFKAEHKLKEETAGLNTQLQNHKSQLAKKEIIIKLKSLHIDSLSQTKRFQSRNSFSKKLEKIISNSSRFDQQWYLENNNDVKEAGISPITHYARFGFFEARDPFARFNLVDFLIQNPSLFSQSVDVIFEEIFNKMQ